MSGLDHGAVNRPLQWFGAFGRKVYSEPENRLNQPIYATAVAAFSSFMPVISHRGEAFGMSHCVMEINPSHGS